MESQTLFKRIVENKESMVPTLFKPVQFNIIKKLRVCRNLNDNEKRYLRGKIKQKLFAIGQLVREKNDRDELVTILHSIGSYYITGLEALKHNGFGWYYQPKIIEVMNTRIQGSIEVSNKRLKFIRVRTIQNSSFVVDEGLKYATNEQILRDTTITKNQYTRKLWIEMLSRYRKMFVKNFDRYRYLIPRQEVIDLNKYGV